jgi:hypothetical protein
VHDRPCLLAAVAGIDAHLVRVETDSAVGVPAFAIVGLPDRALNESRERIRAAIVNSGFDFPPGRLLVNLTPADMRKAGAGFDLAIALALLATDEQIERPALHEYVVCGELALDGSLRAVPGVLAMALAAKRAGFARILAPEANRDEAALVDEIDVYAVPTLADAKTRSEGTPTRPTCGFCPCRDRRRGSLDGFSLRDCGSVCVQMLHVVAPRWRIRINLVSSRNLCLSSRGRSKFRQLCFELGKALRRADPSDVPSRLDYRGLESRVGRRRRPELTVNLN